jgi:hypothetical protein
VATDLGRYRRPREVEQPLPGGVVERVHRGSRRASIAGDRRARLSPDRASGPPERAVLKPGHYEAVFEACFTGFQSAAAR